ncbi:hypothetical protein H8E88_32485 [candidate division KSB1 bacterium]|nr:hypothetical protein [candidate division KSB1 bacterium]MBL7095516.1 hypothetical protein [candidate division KSB1 bacterium]
MWKQCLGWSYLKSELEITLMPIPLQPYHQTNVIVSLILAADEPLPGQSVLKFLLPGQKKLIHD